MHPVTLWLTGLLLLAGAVIAGLFHFADKWGSVTDLADLSKPVPKHAKWVGEGDTTKLRPPPPPDIDPLDWPGRVLD